MGNHEKLIEGLFTEIKLRTNTRLLAMDIEPHSRPRGRPENIADIICIGKKWCRVARTLIPSYDHACHFAVSWSADCEGVPCDVVCEVGGKELFPECACDCPASKRSSKPEDENEEERKSKSKKKLAKKLTKKMATSLFKMLGKTLVPIAVEKVIESQTS
ncbi:hypothetical protein TNIN_2251 [Trichonephila inaurata madagascariensis]|uniref:Uncharacterized protein n=1 Tax=Trichonephila inaurata madagascariensis TaxID=2747483 RepID=A0A8X6WQM0_9ARAC|nr:hypothetical protein TNIN_2251 [Trichonephila inaurata madagascariensis]